ncbi:hypothetical protein RRG08_056430 [Elysia crispata]|uniref:Uncharacterized protein n=1 Tax=Elysia crispata TaxID=231223 RepID=A0AAE1D7H2_9GAST|nr:hypothetical protein RRG08_056430 [Elysia crispata]
MRAPLPGPALCFELYINRMLYDFGEAATRVPIMSRMSPAQVNQCGLPEGLGSLGLEVDLNHMYNISAGAVMRWRPDLVRPFLDCFLGDEHKTQ